MTTPLSLADQSVFDGTETVTLRARGEVAGPLVAGALRRQAVRQEAQPGDGTCLSADVRWHLPAGGLPDEPLPGATIVDSQGEVWTVLAAELQTLGSRYVCTCRNLAIAGGLNEYVTLQTAVWTLEQHGAPLAAWSHAGPPLRARLQLQTAEPQSPHGQPGLSRRYRIYLAETIPLTASSRFLHNGIPYRITGHHQPERIDALFVVEAEEMRNAEC
ncbi:MAG: hypothetical protein AB7I37_08350 [Pirellulales bacterium]